MTLTWGGVTFQERWEDGWAPLPQQQLYVSVEHYPETDTDEVQLGGLGGNDVTVPAIIATAADLAALRAAMGLGTTDTLTGLWSGSLNNMALVAISNPRGVYNDPRITAELHFIAAVA